MMILPLRELQNAHRSLATITLLKRVKNTVVTIAAEFLVDECIVHPEEELR